MNWDSFQSNLDLDDIQSEKIKDILKHFRDQYTEICLLDSKESRKSPVEYAATLKVDSPHMDKDAFDKIFISFLKKERIPVCDLTYIEASLQSDLLTRAKIYQLLRDEQKSIFQKLQIESMLDIDTGYDPFGTKLVEEMIHKQKIVTDRGNSPFFSKSFCILPWIHTFVGVSGKVKLCSISSESLTGNSGNSPLSLQSRSLREIWNSAEMREVRRKMLAGKKVPACSTCDREADTGQTTGRDFYNNYWTREDDKREEWLQRVHRSAQNDYEVSSLPVYYELYPGNMCNLRCRMCNADYSSSIENDSIHSFCAQKSPHSEETRFSNDVQWFASDGTVMDELLDKIQETRMFSLSGGEPLLNPFVNKLIDILIKRRVSPEIDLQFFTNLTVFPENLFKKLMRFKSVRFNISIDGFGPVYEYIRYPAKWEDVALNLKHLSGYANFSCVITPTVQNYNILSIISLLEFAESLNLPSNFNILSTPHFLSIRAMPVKARILAITLLLEYMERSAFVKEFPGMAGSINNVIMELKENTQKPYPDTMQEFILFTHELDESRGQSFKDTCPELYDFIIGDGFTWITDQISAIQGSRETSYQLLEEIGNGKYIAWDTLRKQLKLDKSSVKKLRKVLNKGKDQFTDICLRKTTDDKDSPVQYAAGLRLGPEPPDEEDFRKRFTAYMSEKKDSVSRLTYLKAGEELDRSISSKIDTILRNKEKEALAGLGQISFLYIDTGHDPLGDALTEKIKNIKISRIARVNTTKYKDFFCPLPFEYATVCDNGDVYLCSACKMRSSVGNLTKSTLKDAWNSNIAIDVRKAILDGSYKYCNENECEYLQDWKLRKKDEFTGEFYKNIIAKKITTLEQGPLTIEVSYDKSCNLACPYCRQEHIMCKGDEIRRLRKIHNKVFNNNLHGVKRLMISGCGDPLASRFHRDVLRKLDGTLFPDIRIKLQTNGLLLAPKMWESLGSSHYAIDWISISIDAASEDTYRINRGGNFNKLLRNLEFVSELRKENIIKAFNINFVVQANNFREMKQFIEMGKRYGCDYINFQKIMNLGIDYGLYSDEEYRRVAVHLESHPEHAEFLKVLNDPVFLDTRIGLFKLLEFFPDEIRKKKDVDSIIKYYPECERDRIYR